MRRKPTKSACYHEAGHAVVGASLGAFVSFVAVKSGVGHSVTLANGYRLRGKGTAYVQQFAAPTANNVLPSDSTFQATVRQIAVSMSGPIAHAKASKIALYKSLLAGGLADYNAAVALVDTIHEKHRSDAWQQAGTLASDVIARRWRIIQVVAESLMQDGFVDGSVVNTMVAKHDAKLAEMHAQIDELVALSEKVSPDFWQD